MVGNRNPSVIETLPMKLTRNLPEVCGETALRFDKRYDIGSVSKTLYSYY